MSELPTAERQTLLRKIMSTEGFDTLEELLEACVFDSICPAICSDPTCAHVAEMEPDQTEGWCEACGSNSMISALALAGLI